KDSEDHTSSPELPGGISSRQLFQRSYPSSLFVFLNTTSSSSTSSPETLSSYKNLHLFNFESSLLNHLPPSNASTPLNRSPSSWMALTSARERMLSSKSLR